MPIWEHGTVELVCQDVGHQAGVVVGVRFRGMNDRKVAKQCAGDGRRADVGADVQHAASDDEPPHSGEVIKGLDAAVLKMNEGEHMVWEIPPALGYGSSGVPGV